MRTDSFKRMTAFFALTATIVAAVPSHAQNASPTLKTSAVTPAAQSPTIERQNLGRPPNVRQVPTVTNPQPLKVATQGGRSSPPANAANPGASANTSTTKTQSPTRKRVRITRVRRRGQTRVRRTKKAKPAWARKLLQSD